MTERPLARILDRLLGRKCPLCRAKVPRGVRYCPRHTNVQITQYEESRR